PAHPVASVCIAECLGMTTEAHTGGDIGAHDFPGIALLQPLIGHLDLRALVETLLEDAELVADPVADRRHFERRQRIEVAGAESSESAVAKPGLFLEREQRIEILIERCHRLPRVRLDAEIDEVVPELRADEELCREVTGHLDVAPLVGTPGALPAR